VIPIIEHTDIPNRDPYNKYSVKLLLCPIEGLLELGRLLTCLNIDNIYLSKLQVLLAKIRNALNEGTHYRDPYKLAPLVIYFYFKSKGILIDKEKLLRHSCISRNHFEAFTLQILRFSKKYSVSEK